jgi:hypothetical protein
VFRRKLISWKNAATSRGVMASAPRFELQEVEVRASDCTKSQSSREPLGSLREANSVLSTENLTSRSR